MVWRIITHKIPANRHTFYIELMAEVTAAVVAVLIGWPAMQRTPPQVRLHGTLVPDVVIRGEPAHVRYVTTKPTGPDCPGTVQQEIIDSENTIFSKLAKAVGPAKFDPDPDNPNQSILIGNPVVIPAEAAPGPATFRTASFRYCNWLQKWFHWPISQIGPDIKFTIACRDTDITPKCARAREQR